VAISRRNLAGLGFVPLLLAAAPALGASGQRVSPRRRTAIITECLQTSARYSHCISEGDFTGLAATFAPDGMLEVQGNRMDGREQIHAFFTNSSGLNGVTEHGRLLITNDVIAVEDSNNASGKAFFTIFRISTAAGITVPQLAPAALATSQDRYVRIGDNWLLAQRKINLLAAAAR
jgi:hypothetical protein